MGLFIAMETLKSLPLAEIQYAENKTHSEIEYINSKIMTCPKWHGINQFSIMLFTALHVMQTRSSDENSVRPSVCPSVCLSVTRVNCDKTVERSVQIYTPYERIFSLVF